MKKEKKTFSIRQSFLLSFIVPGIILAVLLVGGLIFLTIFAKTDNRVYLRIAIAYVLTFTALYAGVSLFIFFRLNKIYYQGLYRTTSSLLRGLKSNVASDDFYPDTNITEIKELNEDLKEVNTIISNSTMISADLNSAFIPLVFISEENRIVTLDSFKKELRSLIYCSKINCAAT